jgi:hypothetical protein
MALAARCSSDVVSEFRSCLSSTVRCHNVQDDDDMLQKVPSC